MVIALLFSMGALAQAPSATQCRIGDVARGLSAQDIAGLERLLPADSRAWLLYGDRGQGSTSQEVDHQSDNLVIVDLRDGSPFKTLRAIFQKKGASWVITRVVTGRA